VVESISLHVCLSQTIIWNKKYHAVLLSLKHHYGSAIEPHARLSLLRPEARSVARLPSQLMCDNHRVTVLQQRLNVFEIAEPPPPLSRGFLEVPLRTPGDPGLRKDHGGCGAAFPVMFVTLGRPARRNLFGISTRGASLLPSCQVV